MSSESAHPVFPLFLRVEGRRIVVVGAGAIGTRKIAELLEVGAQVHVVSRSATSAVQELAATGKITLELRAFSPDDVAGAWLVISATDDPEANRAVSEAAESRRMFVCAIDDPDHGSAFFGSVIARPPFLIAISSHGQLPGLTRLVREIIEQALPGPHWVSQARRLRQRWKATRTPMSDRFSELVRTFAAENTHREG